MELLHNDIKNIKKNKLEFVRFIEVPVEKLYVQEPVFLNISDYFNNSSKRKYKWNIIDSPLFDLLKLYEVNGLVKINDIYSKTNYFKLKWKIHRLTMYRGFKQQNKIYKYINSLKLLFFKKKIMKAKLLKFIQIYESIKANGYLGKGFEDRYISVLEKPFVVSRYGLKREWEPYTIWSGHHRSAILAVLGYKTVKVALLKDTLEGK